MINRSKITEFVDEQYESAGIRDFAEEVWSDAYEIKCLASVIEHTLEDLLDRNRTEVKNGRITIKASTNSVDSIETLMSRLTGELDHLERRLLARSNALTFEDNERLRAEREKAS